MAYSDYGGYAYRNGILVSERSDWTLTPEGGVGTPGVWPGFAGVDRNLPHFHAAIGEWPVIVGLYKQSGISIFRGIENIDLRTLMNEKDLAEYMHGKGDNQYLDFSGMDAEAMVRVEVDGVQIEFCVRREDNFYLYAHSKHPDGTVWCGFSGYGVGMGLETCGYGYSTEERIKRLRNLWPESRE